MKKVKGFILKGTFLALIVSILSVLLTITIYGIERDPCPKCNGFLKYTTTVEPTCTGNGLTKVECNGCNYEAVLLINFTGHGDYISDFENNDNEESHTRINKCEKCGEIETSWEEDHTFIKDDGSRNTDYGVITIAPTCTEKGERTYTCGLCGYTCTEEVEATGHGDTNDFITFNEEYHTIHTICEICNEEVGEPKTDKHDMDMDNGVITKDATCIKKGEITYTCKECGYPDPEEKIDIDPTNHENIIEYVSEYDLYGNQHAALHGIYTECKDCKEIQRIDWVVHSFVETYEAEETEYEDYITYRTEEGKIKTAPTCTTKGERTYTCKDCGFIATEDIDIDPTKHKMTIEKIIKEATCTENGEKTYTCELCGYTDPETEEIEKSSQYHGWDWDNKKVIEEGTCTKTGEVEYACKYCGETRTDPTDTNPEKHTLSNIEVTDQPTCTEKGKGIRVCIDCGYTTDPEEIDIDPQNHAWNNGEVTKQPTCTEEGIKTYTCTREGCGATRTEAIEKNAENHAWNSGEITKEPTCKETGIKKYTCTRQGCGETKTETIEANPENHKFGEWKIEKEPTYEEEGLKYRKCTICNTEREEEKIPKLTTEQINISTTYETKEIENNKYVVISKEIEKEEFLKNIVSTNSEIIVKDKDGNEIGSKDKVGTGAKVITKKNGKEQYIVVLKGDINSDGIVNFRDIIRANAVRIGSLENSMLKAQLLAADINNTNKIEFRDIITINAIRINSGN